MGYGNFKNLVVKDGKVAECEVHDSARAEKSNKRIGYSREEKAQFAKQKRDERELQDFINGAKNADFIEID